MNRIVWNNYPHEKLPDDVRDVVDPSRAITLVIEQSDEAAKANGLTRFSGRFPGRDVTSHEAVARIRTLRDEWD